VHTAGAAAGLDAEHAVLEDEALVGRDGRLAGRQPVVDGAQRQQVDVGVRLAAAGHHAGVVAHHAPRRGEHGEELGQVRRLEPEVDLGRRRGQREVHAATGGGGGLRRRREVPVSRAAQVRQQARDAGQRARRGEVGALQGRELGEVLVVADGQAGPVVEDLVALDGGAALQLGLDGPGEGGPAVALQDHVDAQRVQVFGVEEEAVHVEEAGPDGGEAGRRGLLAGGGDGDGFGIEGGLLGPGGHCDGCRSGARWLRKGNGRGLVVSTSSQLAALSNRDADIRHLG